VFRLRVVADADPGAIPLVLSRFQILNVVPRRVVAEFGSDDIVHIEIDVSGLSEAQIAGVAGKVGQSPCIRNSYWHRL
jgi:hypothetical protein